MVCSFASDRLLEILSYCVIGAVEVQWRGGKDALEMQWRCSNDAVEMQWSGVSPQKHSQKHFYIV